MIHIHKKAALLTALGLAVALTACGPEDIRPADPSAGTYATQDRMTALEYSVWMSKQVAAFSGDILARVIAIEGMRQNANPGEPAAARAALREMEGIRDSVMTAFPAKEKDADRLATLSAMNAAIDHVRSYVEDLESGRVELKHQAVLQADYNAVTAFGGVYAQ